MYHGPETVTQGRVLSVDEVKGIGQYGIIDHLARFTYGENCRLRSGSSRVSSGPSALRPDRRRGMGAPGA